MYERKQLIKGIYLKETVFSWGYDLPGLTTTMNTFEAWSQWGCKQGVRVFCPTPPEKIFSVVWNGKWLATRLAILSHTCFIDFMSREYVDYSIRPSSKQKSCIKISLCGLQLSLINMKLYSIKDYNRSESLIFI